MRERDGKGHAAERAGPGPPPAPTAAPIPQGPARLSPHPAAPGHPIPGPIPCSLSHSRSRSRSTPAVSSPRSPPGPPHGNRPRATSGCAAGRDASAMTSRRSREGIPRGRDHGRGRGQERGRGHKRGVANGRCHRRGAVKGAWPRQSGRGQEGPGELQVKPGKNRYKKDQKSL